MLTIFSLSYINDFILKKRKKTHGCYNREIQKGSIKTFFKSFTFVPVLNLWCMCVTLLCDL